MMTALRNASTASGGVDVSASEEVTRTTNAAAIPNIIRARMAKPDDRDARRTRRPRIPSADDVGRATATPGSLPGLIDVLDYIYQTEGPASQTRQALSFTTVK